MKPDKNIEKFTKYIIEEAQVESPSSNFVNKVMDSVKLESKLSISRVYKPLISKPAWIVIMVVFVALSIFILAGNYENATIFSKIDLTFLDKILSFNLFERIHFSTTFTFSFVIFSILVLIQIAAIKNYFNKQHVA